VAAAITSRTGTPARPPLIWASWSGEAGAGSGLDGARSADDDGGGGPSPSGAEPPPPESPPELPPEPLLELSAVLPPAPLPAAGPLPGRPAWGGHEVTVAAHAPANAAPASTTSPDTINARGRRGLRACAPRGPRAITAISTAAAAASSSTASPTPHVCDIPPPDDQTHRAPDRAMPLG
jgi:hypothetical protein